MRTNNAQFQFEKHQSSQSYFLVLVGIIGDLLGETPEEHDAIRERILAETTVWFNFQQRLRKLACIHLVQEKWEQLNRRDQEKLADSILTYYKSEQTFREVVEEMRSIFRPMCTENEDPLDGLPTLSQISTRQEKLSGYQSLSEFTKEIKEKLKLREVKSVQFKQKTGKPFEYDCCVCNKAVKLVRESDSLTERLDGKEPFQIVHQGCTKDYVAQIIERKEKELRKSDADKWTQGIMKDVREAFKRQQQTIHELSAENIQLQKSVNNCLDLVVQLNAENAQKEEQVGELQQQLQVAVDNAESSQVKLENVGKECKDWLARIESITGVKTKVKVEQKEDEDPSSTSQKRGGQVAVNVTVKKEVEEDGEPNNINYEDDNTDQAVEALNTKMSKQRIE